jgi:hypothetical protein
MLVTVNSCPDGRCSITFAGKLVAVGVGGMDVGVSVGGEIVEVGDKVCDGGRLDGWLVMAAGAPVVAQAPSDRTSMHNKSMKDILFIKISSKTIQRILYLAGLF